MDIWLIIANPYAYDKALAEALSLAQQPGARLHVAFFISDSSVTDTIHELADTGLLGPGSLRNLRSNMLAGYRGLADDVLKRVQRKAAQIPVVIEGVVEQDSLRDYLPQIYQRSDVNRIVIGGSRLMASRLGTIPEHVVFIAEE
ncbi:MAG: hypothetical protein AAGG02_18525 [Cyanobacteria bacterium P01_H01_bin.15]